ncbi:MAG: peptidoglycan-associated lipoprotein [Gammaproteobacteria bacterium]|nr:MAG: peptidoglycan-associated lipoprotein [Gammaproteobacteria bacterium]
MSIFTRKHLIALMAAASIAGCSTTPDDSTATDSYDNQDASSSTEATYGAGDDSVDGSSAMMDTPVEPSLKDLAMQSTVVFFDFDKSNIRPDAYNTLKAHAAYLSANPSAAVRLEGHTDERGTREYNLALGERRGIAASNYLTANGASSSQITVITYGEERPVAEGHNEAAWSQNRRVEIKYY